MPLVERPWIDLSPGVIQATGNSLDVALSGSGFLAVQGPNGTLYTRNGSLRVAADGKLTTSDGLPLRSTAGGVLTLEPSRPVDISADGTVAQDGNVVGQLDLADLSAASIAKQGSNYMRVTAASAPIARPAGTTVEQGKLESSNTASAESAVRLVSVMRQFEMLQKAVSLGAEMNQRAIEEVAKVGS
jgi:flagellar basal body rod protein FlgG